MGLGKTYSTKYLLDSNNNSGVAGQVLSTTSTGIDWVDANTVPGAGLWLESGNDIYNSNSGNVAIGVTTTGAKLQIDKANANSSVIISRSGTNIGASTGVGSITFPSHYNSSYTDYAAIQAYSNNLSSVRGSLDLKVKSTSGTLLTGLTVYGTSSGVNVGIGTDSPLRKLHVGGNFAVNAGTGEYYGVNITGGEGANPTILIGDWHNSSANISWNSTGNYLRIDAQHSTSGAPIVFSGNDSAIEYMRINSTGNVGIGVTSPQSKLELGPNGSLGADITNKNVILNVDGGYGTTGTPASGQYKVMGFVGTTRDVTDITGQTSGEVLKNFYLGMIGGDYFNVNRFSFWQGGDERLTIQGYGTNAGNIGINSTNPTAKLHIAKTTTWGEMSNPIINIQNNGTGGDINTAHNMGSITWLSGTVSTAEIKAVRNTPASGDNVELRFSTSASGVQGERMTINNNGIVLINNSLGVNVTSITTGYKLVVGGGDISANQAVAKISLGQIGSQGDAHFGASGLGSPTVGSQDYGFYSAHNAYRTSTGAWKHSRADAIGAVRILGSGGGSSGNAGFSFDYSANNGTSDITWTNLMHLSTGGNLQLPEYGAGVLVSDGNGTITSGGDIDIDAEVIINDNLVNYRFTSLENTSIQYWLLCLNAGSNDVNGTLWGDRSSGHHQAMNLDIVVSAKSATMQTGMLTTKQVLEYNEKYTLVTLTYNSVSYVAIKYDGHPYPITGNGYFTGLLKSTIGTNFLTALNASQVSAVAAFSNANTKATIQADKVGIGTDDPNSTLEVNGTLNTGNADGGVWLRESGSKGEILGLNNDGTVYSDLSIRSASGTQLYLDTNGNVGIGTTSPVVPLDVEGKIRSNDDSSNDYFEIFCDGSGSGDSYIENTSNNIQIKSAFATSFSTSGSVAMFIDENQNVGIGGNAPSYLLDVRDGTTSGAIARFSAINPHVIIESSTAGNAVLHLKPNATGAKNGQFKVTAGNGYGFSWSNDASGTGETAYMDLDTSTTGGGDLTVKGDVIAYGAPSDRKYKENIKPIESALDKAMQLQGVTFDWKDSDSILDIKEDIGFIAQDVQEVLPELVRDSGKGNLSLRYQGITPILLEAIKELKAEIDLLKSKPCTCNKCNCNI